MMLNVNKIRRDFPILERKVHGKQLAYLDSAATTQKPRQVIRAISGYYEESNANIHRSAHTLASEATEAYEDSRQEVASFIGAGDAEEIVFVRNATEAINLVADTWAKENVKKGDEILVSIMEHHSNLVPWQEFQKRGVKLAFAGITVDGTLDYDDFESKLSRKTRFVAITGKSNVLGTTVGLKKIIRLAHDNGSMVLVDGAQAVPNIPTDVRALDCDFLAFSGHKMLGPMGIGVLYGKKELLDGMPPFLFGGDMIKQVRRQDAEFNDVPWKFEAGTPNVEGAVGLAAAIGYLEKVGIGNVSKRQVELTAYALKQLSELDNVTIFGSKDARKRPGVISFEVAGIHPHDVAEVLDFEGVAVRAGYHCAQPLVESLSSKPTVRASFYVYSTEKEVDRLCAGIEKAGRFFGVRQSLRRKRASERDK